MTARYVTLTSGVVVPYPEPTSPEATAIGRANRRVDTKAEMAIRSELHRRGLRFRKDLLVRGEGVKAHADIAFTRARVAVFVDGCFWHGCPEHFHAPKSNTGYWEPKMRANRERDERVNKGLGAGGWRVVRLWEHEPVPVAADVIEGVVRARLAGLR